MTAITMKTIKAESRPLDNATLQVICDTIEQTKNVKVLSCYVEHNDVYGVYINDAHNVLSVWERPADDILTEIDGHHLYFFELGFFIRGIYAYGAVHIYNTLMHPSDIACGYEEEFESILELIRDNPPVLSIARQIRDDIGILDDDVSYDNLNRLIDYINASKSIYDFGTYEMVSDKKGFVKAMNALSKLRQDLRLEDFDKVSEKKMNDIDQLFVNLIVKVFILDRI